MLKLRYYQQDAIDNCFKYICKAENYGNNPLIVLPTGSGKSLVIAKIAEMVLSDKNTRVLNLAHQKNLINQNFEEYVGVMEGQLIDAGVYSAGLNRRDTQNRMIFASIQSVHNKAWQLGWFDIILVDECHMINSKDEGTFRSFLNEMKKINPKCVIIGLSATPFRMKGGILCDEENEERLFHSICHETPMPELMSANHPKNIDHIQYLCPLVSPGIVNYADISKVHTMAGEFNLKEMEEAFNQDALVDRAVQEILTKAINRKKILVFSAGIKHAQTIYDAFKRYGVDAGLVHSKNVDSDLELEKFKTTDLRVMINCDVLTTGYNQKNIDCIAMLRSTKSIGLYVQIAGRGIRMSPDKNDCLYLDFGTNIERMGPIDKIEIFKKKKGRFVVGGAPVKRCPKCNYMVAVSANICPDCGYEFPETPKHEDKASDADILSTWKKPETIDVQKIVYSAHWKENVIFPSLRVDYYTDIASFESEWVCIEHTGFAKNRAIQWIKNRTETPFKTVQELLDNEDVLRKPKQIIIDKNQKFHKIIGYLF